MLELPEHILDTMVTIVEPSPPNVDNHPNDLYTIISQACNKKGTICITLKCEDLVKEFNRRVQRMQLKEREADKHETIVRASM